MTKCYLFSDRAQGLGRPQQMSVTVKVQSIAGPEINAPLNILQTDPTTMNAGSGWALAGDGSINRTNIAIPEFIAGSAEELAATGTGFNTVNVTVKHSPSRFFLILLVEELLLLKSQLKEFRHIIVSCSG